MEDLTQLEAQCEAQGAILGMRTEGNGFEPLCVRLELVGDGAIVLHVGTDTILLKEARLREHLRRIGLVDDQVG